jgi:8-amino-7-oxononanoate synthase
MNADKQLEGLRARLLGKSRMGAAAEDASTAARPAAPRVKVGPEHYDFAHFPELREYTNTRWYYDKQGYEWNMFREHVGVASAEV